MIASTEGLAHLRLLIEGRWPGAKYTIRAGRFRQTDDRRLLAEQPESGIHQRYEILPLAWRDGHEETGEANVAGTLVDSTLEAVLRVGYFWGGGDMDDGGILGVTTAALEDAFVLRRALTYPDNLDRNNTGIVNVRMGPAVLPSFDVDGDRRSVMEMPLVVQLIDDWSSE